jgi:hypothetical protein
MSPEEEEVNLDVQSVAYVGQGVYDYVKRGRYHEDPFERGAF